MASIVSVFAAAAERIDLAAVSASPAADREQLAAAVYLAADPMWRIIVALGLEASPPGLRAREIWSISIGSIAAACVSRDCSSGVGYAGVLQSDAPEHRHAIV